MKSRVFFFAFLLIGAGVLRAQFNWAHTDGPYGSVVSFIFSNGQYVVVPESNYLYRSSDGEHWEKLAHRVSSNLSLWGDTIASLVTNPISNKAELHVSTDRGENWSIQPVPESADVYSAGIFVCRSSINLPLIGKSQMYRSFDLGVSWDTIAYPGQFSTEIATFDNRLYVLREDGIKRSDEDGNNWSAVIGPPFSNYEKSFVMTAANDSILIFASDDRIWYTHDAGITWANKSVYPGNSEVKITRAGNKIYAHLNNLLLRSGDFGITWDTLQTSDLPYVISSTALGDKYLFSSFDQGIFRWDENSEAIVRSSSGLGFGKIDELTLGQDRIWAACPNGLFAFDLASKTWSDHMDIPIPDKAPVFVTANDHGWVATSGREGGFYFSEDNGQSWIAISNDMIHLSSAASDRIELLGNTMIALTRDGVMRSLDKGINWEGIGASNIHTEMVRAHNKYYMASSEFLYESADNGLTWITHFFPSEIEGIGAYKEDLYLVSYDYSNHLRELSISPNGVDWYAGGPGYYSSYAYGVPYFYHTTFFRDEDYYYSLTPGNGVHITSIADLTSSAFPMTLYGNDYIALDSVIYLGGQGMFESKIENPFITAIKEVKTSVQTAFQIYPNPAFENIHISGNSDLFNEGTIELYSSDGVLCFSKKISAGENQLDISLRDLPPSIYQIVLISKDHVESHSFLKR